ncbi:MAG: O-antigen ligase family protein [Candidatus Riflebacteria bacterium]|nr:O-antigen ligase family protein [Candidatus Riflebacteria bacterium]
MPSPASTASSTGTSRAPYPSRRVTSGLPIVLLATAIGLVVGSVIGYSGKGSYVLFCLAPLIGVSLVIWPQTLLVHIPVLMMLFQGGSHFGFEDGAVRVLDVYTMWVGQLGTISAVELFTWAAAFICLVALPPRARAILRGDSAFFALLALCGLYLLYVGRALLEGNSVAASINVLGGRFFISWLCVYFVVNVTLSRPVHMRTIAGFMLTLAVLRAIFGLARFVFFGGDPQNPYNSPGAPLVSLVFFDQPDSMCMAWALAACSMTLSRGRLTRLTEKILIVASMFAFLTVILGSIRRTAWAGLAALLLWHFLLLRRSHSVVLAVGTLLCVWPMRHFLLRRFDSVAHGNLLEKLSYDTGRFQEWILALAAIDRSPVFGLGVDAEYQGLPSPFWAASPKLVHNAFIMAWMKLGVVAPLLLAAFLAIIMVRAYVTIRSRASFDRALWAFSAAGALLFNMLSFVFASPWIELRQVIVVAFMSGAVSVASRAERVSPDGPPDRERPG